MRIDTNERIDVTIHRLNGQIVPIRIPEHRERSFRGILAYCSPRYRQAGYRTRKDAQSIDIAKK